MDALTVAGIASAGVIVAIMLGVMRDAAKREQATPDPYRQATRPRTVSYTGRRAGDLCPDLSCRMASRGHQRRACGNLSASVGDTPLMVTDWTSGEPVERPYRDDIRSGKNSA